MYLRRAVAFLALIALVAGCDRPGIFPTTGPTISGVTASDSFDPVPDPRVLRQVFSDFGQDLPVRAGDKITDAALIVRVNVPDEVHLVGVHPQIDGVVDGKVQVLGTHVRAITLDGFGPPYGVQRGYPPTVAPGELLPVAGAVLVPSGFPEISYEIFIGLSIAAGTSHISAVSIDYQGIGGVATLTFRQDLTICVTAADAVDCREDR